MKATMPMIRQYEHPALIDYELFQGPRGPIFLAFVDAKSGEKVCPTRKELEFLKKYIDLRLSWIREDEGEAALTGVQSVGDGAGAESANPGSGSEGTKAATVATNPSAPEMEA